MNIRVLVLAVFCGAFAAVAFGKTIYVSSTATGGGDGSELNPYTMSEAWSKVKANDTIQLADGAYVEETARGDSACFTVRDKANVTFQGNTNHPENVIIDFNGTSNRGFYSPNQSFTIRGITFQNKKTNGNPGVIAAGGTITGTALVENCRFVNITTDQTSSSSNGRMGTVFLGGATADFVFRNCEIKDCNCYTWGVMYLTAGDLTLENCTVTNCHSKNTSGSVVGVNGGASLAIEDCEFNDVGSEMGADNGESNSSGVIHVNTGKVPVVVRRSTFWQGPDCHSRLGGFSALQQNNDIAFEDCEFYDFHAGNGWAGLFYFAGDNASLRMSNCVVSNAAVKTNGGVIGVNGASAKVVLNDCRFMDCRCLNQDSSAIGGLIYVAKANCTLAMTNCVCEAVGDFEGTQAYNGGQINVNNVGGAAVSVERCVFRGIKALNAGAAIFSKATSGSLTVRNSLFTGLDITKQTSGATGIYTTGTSDVKIENCTFADNCPHGNSSNVAPLSPASSTAKNYVKNCIFWNNRDQAGSGALRVTSSTGNTVFENCVADVSGLTGVTKISASPFKDTENGDYTLPKKVDGAPNPCLGAGVKLDWMTADSLDLAGNPRLRGNDLVVDLGCYEFFQKAGLCLVIR